MSALTGLWPECIAYIVQSDLVNINEDALYPTLRGCITTTHCYRPIRGPTSSTPEVQTRRKEEDLEGAVLILTQAKGRCGKS